MTDRAVMKMALAKLEHLWEIGIDAEYKVELLPEIEALRQALAQPESPVCCGDYEKCMKACTPRGRWLVEKELAQLEQEPVAWISDSPTKGNGKQLHFTKASAWKWSSNIKPLYTAPPPKPWVWLTDEDAENICMQGVLNDWHYEQVIDAVESRLKEKNGG